jgi:photosystem II stability/assembly factor-like uncharacterized protein
VAIKVARLRSPCGRRRLRLPLALGAGVAAIVFGSLVGAGTAAAKEVRATPRLIDVSFVSSRTLFAAGNGIFKSSTAGRKWTRQLALASGRQLRAIDFVDARHGWAVGSGGLIYATRDGGRHWVRRPSGTRRDLVGVDFVDRLHGWAVGGPTVILRTTNGGRSWKRQLVLSASRYRYPSVVRFFSRSVGLVGGFCYGSTPWHLSRTRDGGRHWPTVSLGIWGGMTDIDLAGRSACAVGYLPYEMGSYPPIAVSNDRGKTWQKRSLPWPAALHHVDMVGSTVYTLGGDDLSPGYWLFRSRDSGVSWDRFRAPADAVAGMRFRSTSNGTLVARNGATFVTLDGGATWQRR